MARTSTDRWNSLMGRALLLLVAAILLLIFGPRTEAGHLPWWWHLLIITATLLFFIGQRGKAKALRLESLGTKMKQARAALDAALAAGERSLEAKAHFDVGIAYQASYNAPRRGEPPDYGPLRTALEHLCRARDLYAEFGDAEGQGLALSNLGVIYSVMHRDDEAVAHLQNALDIAKTLNRPGWERSTLNRLTRLLREMEREAGPIELIKARLGAVIVTFCVVWFTVVQGTRCVTGQWADANRGKIGTAALIAGIVAALMMRIGTASRVRFLPKGNIVVLPGREVWRANPTLARARCPRCRSRNLLWYQYGSKSVTADSAIYMRCQNCGNDEYAQL